MFSAFSRPRMRVRPAADIVETGEGIRVLLNVPGVKREHLTVERKDEGLLITGFSSCCEAACLRRKGGSVSSMEFVDMEFRVSIALPGELAAAPVKAMLHNGVLSLLVRREKTSRRVPILAE